MFRPTSKFRKIIVASAISFLILAGFGLGIYFWYFKKPPTPAPAQEASQSSTTTVREEKRVPCPLCGELVSPDKLGRHILAVVIENHPDARPQSGLNQAEIVYEALTEGGITRFLAFYYCHEAEELGPVRSARTYFLDWLSPYQAAFAHAGGSAEALALIPQYHIRDLNHSANYFWRVNWRQAPHNLYTNTKNLWAYALAKKYSPPQFPTYSFKEDEPSSNPQASNIVINYSNSNFVVKYHYEIATNRYLRFQGGRAFKDKLTGEQIAPKNIIVAFMQITPKQGGGVTIKTSGSGKILAFLDGRVIAGTWQKKSREEKLFFYDQEGKEISFNRGSLWIEVVPLGTKVSY